MTVLSFKDRVKHTVSSGGSGSLTLGSASSGYQAFAAGNDGGLFPYVIEDGTAWETGYGTYTHSGTAFARTTRTASSTGSALTVSTSAFVYVDVIADLVAAYDLAMQTFITGLVVTKHTGANTLDISAGSAYVPAVGKVVTYAGATGVSAGSLGADQWNQVFLSGAAAIEVVNNTDPPSSPYAGKARQGGTGSNRRWIGAFRTDGLGDILDFTSFEVASGLIEVAYLSDIGSTGSRVLNAGTSVTYVQVSLITRVPRYAATGAFISMHTACNVGGSESRLSIDGVNVMFEPQTPATASGLATVGGIMPIERSTPSVYYLTGSTAYIDVNMYRAAR